MGENVKMYLREMRCDGGSFLGSCLMVCFCVSGAEPSGFDTTVLAIPKASLIFLLFAKIKP
jgi:hypothetical protein